MLYGASEDQRLLAVHPVGDARMRVYTRTESRITSSDHDFFPFFFLSDSSFLKGFWARHWIKELSGDNYYRFLCAFTSWPGMWEAINHLIRRYNAETHSTVESYRDLPIVHFRTDPASQFMMQSGMTLFKGMEFHDLHRMQLDIETYTSSGFRFSNANRSDDRVIVVALSDNRGWKQALTGEHMDERTLLTELVKLIKQLDPDVIEGHNIFNFDLPYIMKRCEMLGVEFTIGRDGSAPRVADARTTFAERSIDYSKYEVAGRHIIDTWLLAQSYDAAKRALESYGLKYLARHFGFAGEDRIYIQPDRIPWYWDHEPDLLVRYALDDVHETMRLSELLSQSTFFLTQMLPFNYGAVATMGSSTKVESLLLREYLRQRHSLPRPDTRLPTSGGYTDVFYTGIMGPILDVDVESLYPSIMLHDGISPSKEALGIFLPLLKALTAQRLEAKRLMADAKETTARARYDALQSSFKILINSFYGYLGYNRALFSDSEAADRVAQTGQRLLRQLINAISVKKGTVVEVDTDGIFFVPPGSKKSESAETTFVREISRSLPEGINLAVKGRYKSILSYKKKNYALLGYDEKINIRGSSLNSRSIENFGRNFIHQCIEALLNNNVANLHELYVSLHRDITEHKLTIADFARTEVLKESYDEYQTAVIGGARNRTAAYEVAIAAGLSWKRGDRVSYYITGSDGHVKGFENCKLSEEWNAEFPDENVAYYLRRLDEFAKKFEPFFTSADFRAIFSVDDLFGFSPVGIQIVTTKLEKEEERAAPVETESIEPTIWLDEN